MKKFIRVISLFMVLFMTGCVEHRYYARHHDHSPRYYHRHPHYRHVDIDIHN